MNEGTKQTGSRISSSEGNKKRVLFTGAVNHGGNNSTGELLKLLVQNVRDYAIFMIDPAGFIVEWTEGAEHVTGYQTHEVLGRHLSLFYTPEEIASGQPARELTEAAATGRIEREGWRIAKDGKRRLINEIATAIRDAQGELLGFAKISRDITERKLMEEALQQSEERLRIVMESVRDQAIITSDPKNIITGWNIGACNLFGYSAQEAIGQPGDIVFTEEDKASGQPAKEVATALKDGHAADERYHVRKDGSTFYVSGAMSPLYTSKGQLLGFVKMARDLTERKMMEERLNTANRRKDEFIAMLGHELRNPLSPVRNSLHIIKMTHPNDSELTPLVDMMLRQIDHMVVLVNDLLDVSRISQGKISLRKQRVDLTALIAESVENFLPVLEGTGRKLHLNLPEKSYFVFADESRIIQVINNILNNAVKYSPEDTGRIWVAAAQSGSMMIIRIRDNGIGIAEGDLTDIFESFVQIEATIDRSMGGLGLGLSVVKKLVELHQGTIHAESEGLGRGSEFIIRLPLAE